MTAEYMTAQTDYDFAHLVDLKRIAGKTMDRQRTRIHRGLTLAAAAACGLAGGSIIMQGDRTQNSMAVVYFLLCGVLLAMFVFFDQAAGWRAKKKMGKNPVTDHFTFGPYGVDIVRGEERAHYPYSDCDRLMETELCFYLFHVRGKGLTISKQSIQGGTPGELRAWLEEKCGVKAQWMGEKQK